MKRLLTGDRPTGKLHLGHYVGTLENRVKLQHKYETFIMLANVQALTDNFDNPARISQNVLEVALDNLAVGLDPNQSALFIQSMIPELAELTVYFMNLVSLARLERNPIIKHEMKQKGYGTNVPVGFLNYPVSQAADILLFKANIVPTGGDQEPIIEQTREIVKKFNTTYGPTLIMPEIKVGRVARLVGTDGSAKMSKSLGNVIYLSDSPESVSSKVMSMYTDPKRLKVTDPGQIEGNPVFIYLDCFGASHHQNQIAIYKQLYGEGKVGDLEIKEYLVAVLNEFLQPIRIKRSHCANQPSLVMEILKHGTEIARSAAVQTMAEVRRAMKLNYF